MIPVLRNALDGIDFIAGHLPFYSGIDELVPPVTFSSIRANEYSGLLVLLPCSLFCMIYLFIKRPDAFNLYLLVYCVFGAVLLLFQYRLNYFGSF